MRYRITTIEVRALWLDG